jgi:general secretion pathway protein I
MTMPDRARGFTLIEVLVALMIVALGMGAVLSALGSAADTTIRLRERTFANWVALNLVATGRLTASFPANGKTEGDIDFANARWHWLQVIEKTQIPGVQRITIQVRHADAAAAHDSAGATGAVTERSDWVATVTDFHGTSLRLGQSVFPNYP